MNTVLRVLVVEDDTVLAGFVGIAFNPDNGKDQYGSQAIAWSAIHA